MRFSYITIQVEDVDKVREWYSTRLELRVLKDSKDYVVLGDTEGGLGLEIRRGKPLENPDRLKLSFQVDDVRVIFKRIYDGGIPFLAGPKKSNFGRTVATLKDPAGHTVEIFSVEQIAVG